MKNSQPVPVPLTAALQSAMLLSRGTRKEVEGWKVRIRRKPCSGFSLYSSSAGERRKRLLRPPILPSRFRTRGPNGLFWGLRWPQRVLIRSPMTSCIAGSRNSGLRLHPCPQQGESSFDFSDRVGIHRHRYSLTSRQCMLGLEAPKLTSTVKIMINCQATYIGVVCTMSWAGRLSFIGHSCTLAVAWRQTLHWHLIARDHIVTHKSDI